MSPYPPVIIRIDDRLIHGQVLVGWCNHLNIRHIIVADDEIAREEWEKNLLLLAVTGQMTAEVLPVSEAVTAIHDRLEGKEKCMVLVASPFYIEQMDRHGLKVRTINVGGIHFKEGRREFLHYLFLSNEEMAVFQKLIQKGYHFVCQDVPDGPQYNLKRVLEKKR